eukprot:PhM_4_TR15620/c2_g1_i1/m.66293/K10133/TP53I3; tumor protein p53-inducible protein 3
MTTFVIPAEMKAVVQSATGGPDTLSIGTVPTPKIKNDDDVIVKVHATAVNRADTVQREGRYPAPPGASPILGLELSGVVVAVGPGVSDLSIGTEVMALLDGGGYAEYAVVARGQVMTVPKGVDLTSAAAIPEVFLTAYQSLVTEHHRGGTKSGDHVLIHAGASGVGTAAIQLCKLFGATPYVT